MSRLTTKIASVGLALATAAMFAGAVIPTASAQTTDINSLLAQIAQLTALVKQLQAGQGSGSMASTYTFTKNLTLGSKGADVKALQEYLNANGYPIAAAGKVGSAGHETEYFGPATKAALAKWQAAMGVKPSVGYFGSLTRAKIASLASTSTGGSSTGGSSTPTGAPMTVALALDNPAGSNIGIGAVNVPVMKLNFTAGSQPMTVTNLVMTRSGLSQDADLNNVYLYDGGTRLATNLGFNNGKVTFSNSGGLFTVPANSTKEITVTADISTTAGGSHIFQLGIGNVADITATGGSFAGAFPITSNAYTLATVSNLATLTVSGAATSTVNVNAGQTNYLVGQFNLQAGNNPVKVTFLRFTNIGSVTPSYLQNVKLMNGSTQLGSTITTLGSDNIATFDLSAAPLMLASGQTVVLSIYADITGGVNRTFQFSLQQASDIQAVDQMYGVGIGATAGSGLSWPIDFYNATINNGGLVISKDAATPTTYAVAGNTNQVFAKFDVLASGDSIKFNELDFQNAGGNTISNFRVVDDQGTQIGTTGSSVTTSYAAGSGNLNYIIPANTTRVLTVYGDLGSSASGTVTITLGGGSSSAQSYTTYSSVSIGTVGGNALTVLTAGSNLTAALDYGLGSPVQAAAGASNVEIGSFTLTAGQVNAVNLTGVGITVTSNTTTSGYIRNLRAMVGSTQIGNVQPTVSAGQTVTFNSAAPVGIAANGSVTVQLYADISSSITATTTSNFITLASVNASTASGNAVSISNTPTGQSVSFNNGGTLSSAIAAGTPSASYLGMGITGNTLAQYQFTADSNGGATVTQMTIKDASGTATSTTAAGDNSTFINYRLVNSAGTTVSTASENSSGVITFNMPASTASNALSITTSNYNTVSLVADTNSYPYASSSGTHAYWLTGYQYTNAAGATTTTSTAHGNLFTVYRTSLNVAQGPSFTAPTSISGGTGQTVAEFNFTAGSGYDATVATVTLSNSGSLIQASTTVPIGLYDAATPSTLLASTTLTGTGNGTFTLNGASGWVIPAGQTKTLLVKIFSAPGAIASVTAGTGSYQVLLQATTWKDSVVNVSSLSPTISLPIAGQSITGLSS